MADNTQQKNNNRKSKGQASAWSLPLSGRLSDDQELLVLEDLDNGNEFYLYPLDRFRMSGKAYICMASYEPETGTHAEPQFVIMRMLESEENQQYFESIRDKKELDKVFHAFYKRMEEKISQG